MKFKQKFAKFFKGRMHDAEWNDFCATLAGMATAFVLVLIILAVMGDPTPLAWRQ